MAMPPIAYNPVFMVSHPATGINGCPDLNRQGPFNIAGMARVQPLNRAVQCVNR
jgi:hypothetical protein